MDGQDSSLMAGNVPLLPRVTYTLEFPNGIPAFETERRFRLTDREPLLFLESETNPELSFLLLPVALVDPDYLLKLSPEDREVIGAVAGSRLLCLAMITAAEDLPPTANLLAPVVVNLDCGRAVQAVRSDAAYSHRHPLLAEEALCS
jgi:flagellar assembly factor FliW